MPSHMAALKTDNLQVTFQPGMVVATAQASRLRHVLKSLSAAFTLVELLAVLATTGILATLAIPPISSLKRAESMNQTVSEISLLLDQARTYAMAHSTYVWVGFAPDTESQQLSVGVVMGTTGETSDLCSPATCPPLAKIRRYDHVMLDDISGIAGMSTNAEKIGSSQIASFQQSSGGVTVTFKEVLQFCPQGEATINTTRGSAHCIQIGLQTVRGSNAHGPNAAVIEVASLSGQVEVFRP